MLFLHRLPEAKGGSGGVGDDAEPAHVQRGSVRYYSPQRALEGVVAVFNDVAEAGNVPLTMPWLA